MVVSVLLHNNGAALLVGLIVGAALFVMAFARGGGMVEANRLDRQSLGLAAPPRYDPASAVGTALAASAIASTAMVNAHYPASFRVFFTFCFYAGIAIAWIVSVRSRTWKSALPAATPRDGVTGLNGSGSIAKPGQDKSE